MKKHAKYLVLAVTLGIMALIFFFSSQPGETSYQLSGAVADTVQHSKVSTITPSWFSTQNFNANIRKWAPRVYLLRAGRQHGGHGAPLDTAHRPMAARPAGGSALHAVRHVG